MRPIAFGCQFGAIRNSVAPFAIAISKRLATGRICFSRRAFRDNFRIADPAVMTFDLFPDCKGLGSETAVGPAGFTGEVSPEHECAG